MTHQLTDAELEAYLDEALTPPEMAAIEVELRKSPKLLKQLARIHSRRDAGVHSLGEIWRRHRISCPTREQMGSFLLGVLDDDAGGLHALPPGSRRLPRVPREPGRPAATAGGIATSRSSCAAASTLTRAPGTSIAR